MSLATSSFLRTIIKAVENHLNQRLPRYRRGTVFGQASDPNKILVAPSGENGVADGYEYPIVRPYTSATVGDPGGPALEDDILILETTPNNPAIQGQLLTNPNDKPNRDGYPGIDKVSITQNDAKKLRAHAITIDHVPPVDGDVPATARDGMLIVSTFDNSLWKRVSGTWYQVGATKWGAVVDTDGFIDVWIAASVTLPTDGTGDQTAHTTPGYTPTVYNTSALGLDGGAGHAAYVKHDQKSITQTADGKLRAHAIKVTHALPPTDSDIPATPRDATLIDCTTDDSLWMRSSGTLHRVSLPAGGTHGQVLTKATDTDYDADWETDEDNGINLDLPGLISLINSISGTSGGAGHPITYSASSVFAGAVAANAFDGDPTSDWGSVGNFAATNGEWLQVDFGVPVPVSRSSVYQDSTTAGQYMVNYQIQASANGSSWTTIANATSTRDPSSLVPVTDVQTFATVTYRYWRILCGPQVYGGTVIGTWSLS